MAYRSVTSGTNNTNNSRKGQAFVVQTDGKNYFHYYRNKGKRVKLSQSVAARYGYTGGNGPFNSKGNPLSSGRQENPGGNPGPPGRGN